MTTPHARDTKLHEPSPHNYEFEPASNLIVLKSFPSRKSPKCLFGTPFVGEFTHVVHAIEPTFILEASRGWSNHRQRASPYGGTHTPVCQTT